VKGAVVYTGDTVVHMGRKEMVVPDKLEVVVDVENPKDCDA
jgi:hypothetical protein